MHISIYSLLSTQNGNLNTFHINSIETVCCAGDLLRLYPFSTPITATSTSSCSPLLCVGLHSGIVELLNTSTGQ